MVTETVNVRFVESGARVIKRRIDEIGTSADRATRGIFLLQRALFVLGGAGIIRGLVGVADALTAVENRLRLTTDSTANLEAVQSQLFDVALRSRSNWQATAEVYNRIALSTRQLGVGQQQVLDVTETLTKASIISGASAREANAALIQLGQGLASDRLSGDELRSVLEQLPFVADLIVDYLNDVGTFGEVTRGTLRQLGKEGKLTSELVFRAIQAGQAQVDQLFGETNITIAQALENVRTRFASAVDAFDDAFEVSTKLARIIDTLSKSFNTLFGIVAIAGVAVAGFITAKVINTVTGYVNVLTRAGQVIGATNALEAARASRQLASATATSTQTAAQLAQVNAGRARLAQITLTARAEYDAAAAAYASGRARDQQTGRFIANAAARDRLTAATARLNQVEALNAGLTARATALRGAAAAADNAAAAASARAGAAAAAQTGIVARLAATFPTLAGAVRLASMAVAGLFTLLAANPITAIISAIALAVTALFAFGDRIKLTEDGVVSLKDAAVAAFQLVVEAISPVVSALVERLQPAIQVVKDSIAFIGQVAADAFNGLLQIVVTVFNAIAGTVIGFVNGTIRAWDLLPAAILDIMNIMRNNVLTAVEELVNGFIEGIRSIPERFSQAMEAIGQFALDAVQFIADAFAALPGAIKSIAEAAGRVLVAAFTNSVNAIKRLLNSLPGVALSVGEDISASFEGVDIELPSLPNFDDMFDEGRLSLDRFKGDVTGAASEVGSIYAEEFANAYSRDIAGEAGAAVLDAASRLGNQVIERARENIAAEPPGGSITNSELDPTGGSGAGSGSGSGSSANSADFASELAQLQQRIELERQYGLQKEITNNILAIERTLKRDLTATEAEQVATATRLVEISRIQGEILQETLGPAETLRLTQAALNGLFAEGAINLEQYNQKLRETQIAADRAAGTLGGGFRAAIASSIQSASQFGETLGDFVVGAAGQAADAIVEFAKTGQFNIRQFFQDLFAQLLKLAAQRLLLQFLGGFMGIPGAGLAGFSQGGSILPSFAGGGSLMPTGPGSTDSQVVAFNKRPDERVDILTPGQQAAQRNNMNGGGGNTTVNSTTNVAAVLSPNDIVNAFDGAEGETVVVNMIQRNASTIRQIVQG